MRRFFLFLCIMIKTIVPIWSWEIGRPGYDVETTAIDEAIIALTWLSAWSICRFEAWNSDSDQMNDTWDDYILEKGIGLLDYYHCPHYVREPQRKSSRREQLRLSWKKGIALDDCAALIIQDGRYTALQSKTERHAYLCYWKHWVYIEEVMKEGIL